MLFMFIAWFYTYYFTIDHDITMTTLVRNIILVSIFFILSKNLPRSILCFNIVLHTNLTFYSILTLENLLTLKMPLAIFAIYSILQI